MPETESEGARVSDHLTMPVSQSTSLIIIAYVFATVLIGFGINPIVQPDVALSFFEMQMPASAADRKLVEALLQVYGARDVFMGLAIGISAYAGHRRILGWVLLATSFVAIADGVITKGYAGTGEWNHWGYAPMVAINGGLLLGILD
ncbi:hypothetical protein K402DRAFT_416010 [Aulographum hederae CBS 113979]|uniref:Uncharacterized protein n=1 Tax=Aulographum hederae CBS 113979 TaxID=1176131 RepID=A0A6G1HGZ4_9PEZI|nr:hypothetical protein K402DRAFT_416010 [Aulographum hederae CBS 113979]